MPKCEDLRKARFRGRDGDFNERKRGAKIRKSGDGVAKVSTESSSPSIEVLVGGWLVGKYFSWELKTTN